MLYEFKADLNKYLSWLGPGSPVRSLTDIIAFNNAHREQEMKYFGQELLEMADAKGPLTSEAYQKALAANRRLARRVRDRCGDDQAPARCARRADLRRCPG